MHMNRDMYSELDMYMDTYMYVGWGGVIGGGMCRVTCTHVCVYA